LILDTNEKELVYFADPMCSWCWGFSPTINKIVSNLKVGVGVRSIMGGLRPYTKEIMTTEMKDYIMGHWHNIHEQSGQPFDFEFSIGEGFVYDTEPSSRAMITIREIDIALEFKYLSKIQSAFYVEMKDVTTGKALADIAMEIGIDSLLFLELFKSEEIRELTKKDFAISQSLGIRGFPTLLKRSGKEFEIVCQGFQPFDNLVDKLSGFIV
jgi:putative protein-disulfide isomerase